MTLEKIETHWKWLKSEPHFHSQEGAWLFADEAFPYLMDIAKAAKEAGCICAMREDHPQARTHSPTCAALTKAVLAFEEAVHEEPDETAEETT